MEQISIGNNEATASAEGDVSRSPSQLNPHRADRKTFLLVERIRRNDLPGQQMEEIQRERKRGEIDREAIRRGNLQPWCVLALTQGYSFLSLSIPTLRDSRQQRETRPLRSFVIGVAVLPARSRNDLSSHSVATSPLPAMDFPTNRDFESVANRSNRFDFPLVEKTRISCVINDEDTRNTHRTDSAHFIFSFFSFFFFFLLFFQYQIVSTTPFEDFLIYLSNE